MNFLNNKILRFLGILILLAAIPLTVIISQKQQDTRQHAGGNFAIGFNVSGITNYGKGDMFQYASSDQIDADLAEMQKMGATVIRVWVGNNRISAQESANRLDAFLTKAQQYNISAIVTFIDFYNSGFNPQGTDQYYTETYQSIHYLNNQFFQSGYQAEYKSFVQTVVNQNKNHANIYSWEPGNELQDSASPQTFISFMQDMSSFIKSLDPSHKVSTGMIASNQTGLSPDQLYSNLPNFDIITIHESLNDHSLLGDVQWATSHGKIAIIEEFGPPSDPSNPTDRSAAVLNDLNFWKDQGVSASLEWGFIARGIGDNGNGDRNSGMDTIWHCADYNQLFSVYQTLTDTPQTTPGPLPPTCPNVTPSITPNSNTKIHISEPISPNSHVDVIATGTTSCSSYILDDPLQSGSGLTNCQQSGGYTCSDPNPTNDGNQCWWKWTCTTGASGTYQFSFGDHPQNFNTPACSSTQTYTISPTAPTATPIPPPISTPTPTPQSNTIAADIDGNGCVGINDFNLWFRDYAAGKTSSQTDINKDGKTDPLDFNLWFITMRTLPATQLCH